MFRLLVSLCLAVMLTACDAPSSPESVSSASASTGAPPRPLPVTADWSRVVAAHSPAWVAAQAPLRVRFARAVVDSSRLGQELTQGVHLKPGQGHRYRFVSESELEILPATPLQRGRVYRVTLEPELLPGLGLEQRFEFEVAPMPLRLEVRLDPLVPVGRDRMALQGRVLVTDQVDAAALQKTVAVRQGGKALDLTWTLEDGGRLARFYTDMVQRQGAEEVVVHWQGAPLEIEDQGEARLAVPAIGDFVVTDVRARSSDQMQVLVSFSEPLQPRQSLSGLVRLNEREVPVRIEGHQLVLLPEASRRGEQALRVESGLRSQSGQRLNQALEQTLMLESLRPGVRFAGRGVILPEHDRLTVPFEAVNVSEVTITALRVYRDNLGQFLQQRELDQQWGMEQLGRYLWRRTMALEDLPRDRWQRYLLDVTELVGQEPGALYQLVLSIDRDQILWNCSDTTPILSTGVELPDYDGGEGRSSTAHVDWSTLSYRNRFDPCDPAYYLYNDGNDTEARQNLLASNIGLLAKQGQDRQLHVTVTDLRRAQPLAGVSVEVFNYQHQRIGQGASNEQGLLSLPLDGVPFYLVARNGQERGYLRLQVGQALPVSHFDVEGEAVQSGVKGVLFGERDVWRPGDAMHLTFVLQDRDRQLPKGHPVTLSLYDPRDNLVLQRTQAQPVGDFYPFTVSTAEDAPTGQWRAQVDVGGLTFQRPVRIETIVPNRLSVTLEGLQEQWRLQQGVPDLTVVGQWLSGAVARRLKTDMTVRLRAVPTRLPGQGDWVFDDPARSLQVDPQTLFEGQLDSQGRVRVPVSLALETPPPGMLQAQLTTRVFEPGGQFSQGTDAVTVHPWETYVGLRLPPLEAYRSWYDTDAPHVVQLRTVNPEGKPVAGRNLEVSLYRLDWRWWWERSGESLARFASAPGHLARDHRTLVTDGAGQVDYTLQVGREEWGRYLLRVCDADGGHCSGQTVYLDWGWGRSRDSGTEGASRLTLHTDRDRYQVGDEAEVRLPEVQAGQALVSLESGTRVLKQFWVRLKESDAVIRIPVTADMAPNVYVSVTLLQPHEQLANDRPLRLFGVVPLMVEDPETRLAPQLQVAEEVRPRQPFTIRVAEAAGQPMTYTLAIVDEGLLGITRFRTPDLHGHFYQREALGVRTWDLFDDVVGAYAGELERLVAIGGSDALELDTADAVRRRFPPVVRFLGAFQLAAGETAEHQVELPSYLGAVRVMVVAGQAQRYGRAEASVRVREPVSLLTTLPRVLGPGEQVRVPVNLFVQDDRIRQVEVSMDADESLFQVRTGHRAVPFTGAGETIAMLDLAVAERLGQGDICVTARAGEHVGSETVHMTVRAPNPPSTVSRWLRLEPGATGRLPLELHGMEGTNEPWLEASVLPPLNLALRLGDLLVYPHGCLEQTTSVAFPQLYLSRLLTMSDEERVEAERNIQHAIDRARRFQLHDGAFSYWPGQSDVHVWATSYVGHFLVEAQRLGHAVPQDVLERWLGWQRETARRFMTGNDTSLEVQAYRLYTLSLAGQPEAGAMNRLRETPRLPSLARWLLAGAYAHMGRHDVASDLLNGLPRKAAEYAQPGVTFGSSLRDDAIRLSVLAALSRHGEALPLAEQMAEQLASSRWYSTQTVAWALSALVQYYGLEDTAGTPHFELVQGDQQLKIQAERPMHRLPLTAQPGEVTVINRAPAALYVMLANRGIPAIEQEQPQQQGLEITAVFRDANGEPLDVAVLPQGSDLTARVTVRNLTGRTVERLVLTQILPSGWQINPGAREQSAAPMEYQDLRDDRVYTYFSLKPGEARTYELSLNASFAGRFYLPGWQVEGMYEGHRRAALAGRWVTVESR